MKLAHILLFWVATSLALCASQEQNLQDSQVESLATPVAKEWIAYIEKYRHKTTVECHEGVTSPLYSYENFQLNILSTGAKDQYLVYYSLKSKFDKTGYGHFVVIVDLGLKTTKVLGAKVKEFDYEEAGTEQLDFPIPTAKREFEDEQAGTGQPATRPESKSEVSDKPQPEAEGRSR